MKSRAARVAAGAAWLDGILPDWHQSVDTEELDMGHAQWCVLGQIFGDYWRAPLFTADRTVVAHGNKARRFGFNEYFHMWPAGMKILGELWAVEIEKRRARPA